MNHDTKQPASPPLPAKDGSGPHAIVPRDGYKVPLIGVPAESVLEECDCCGDVFPLDEMHIDGFQILCGRCRADSPNDNARHGTED